MSRKSGRGLNAWGALGALPSLALLAWSLAATPPRVGGAVWAVTPLLALISLRFGRLAPRCPSGGVALCLALLGLTVAVGGSGGRPDVSWLHLLAILLGVTGVVESGIFLQRLLPGRPEVVMLPS